MNLNIFFKASVVKILESIQDINEFTTTEINKKSGVSHQWVQKVIKDLREEKLIKVIRFEKADDGKIPVYKKRFKRIIITIDDQEFEIA